MGTGKVKVAYEYDRVGVQYNVRRRVAKDELRYT
jgi:hypothetical protein